MKRLIDVFVVIVISPLALPLLVGIALLVRFYLGSPILFRQTRPGRGAIPFKLVKFRSMREMDGPDGRPLPDAERLTPFGRLLRASSLDELPELWNILKGEMTLVGPRPLLMEYLPLYSKRQARRHEVTPGLTGWAQINGRNALSWEEKFERDIWYVDNRSLTLDLKILWLTLIKVLSREGINHAAAATMIRFGGKQNSAGADSKAVGRTDIKAQARPRGKSRS